MIINTIFKDEIKVIEETINTMQMEGCLASFSKYVSDYSKTDEGVEKKYRRKLDDGLPNFVAEIFLEKYTGKSASELLKIIKDNMVEGYSSITDWLNDDTLSTVLESYTDAFMYDRIRNYMIRTLYEVKLEYTKTKEDKEIAELEKNIKSYEASVNNYNLKLEEFKTKLNKLKPE